MKAEDLKNSILQLAMEGKLVPQDSNDEPASVLLEKIRAEKEKLIKEKKIKRNNKESFIFRKNGHFYERIGKKGEPVCIDEEVVFDVPDNWELCRLENLCALLNPKIEEKSKYPYLNAKFLRTKDNPEIKEKGRFIEKNTKVILVDGENSGEVFLTHADGYMGSTFRILHINSEMYDGYILKLLELWKTPLKKSKKGAAIPHLNKDIFNKILVGIPPINEQKRIINEINWIYPLINEYNLNKEKLDKLNSEFPDKLKSSILQEAIQGKLVPQDPNDEPASVLLEKIREEKERLIKEKKIKRNKNESYIFKENNHFYEKIGKNGNTICIDNEIPFEIPETWEWCRLNFVGFLQTGTTPSTKKTEYYGDAIPFIKPGDIYFDKIDYNNESLSNLGKTKSRLIKKNSVMMVCIGGSRGKCYYNERDVCCNQQINTITPYMVNYKFIYYFMISDYFQKIVWEKATGTATPIMNKSNWGNILICLPPLNEQKRIVEKINSLFEELNF